MLNLICNLADLWPLFYMISTWSIICACKDVTMYFVFGWMSSKDVYRGGESESVYCVIEYRMR